MITAWAMFSGEPKRSASPEPASGKASKVGRERYSGPAASASTTSSGWAASPGREAKRPTWPLKACPTSA